MEKSAIRERLKIPKYTTVNGETPFKAGEPELEQLKKYESNGLIELRQGNEKILKAYKTLTQ